MCVGVWVCVRARAHAHAIIEARALYVLGRCSTTDLEQPQIWFTVTQLVLINLRLK